MYEGHPFLTWEPFQHQQAMLEASLVRKQKHVWGIGPNRWGKSDLGAYATASRAFGICPALPGWRATTPAKIGCVALDFKMSKRVTEEKLFKFLPGEEIRRFRQDERRIYLRNGSTIDLYSCDSGREKFQGVDWDYVWFDEEPVEDVWTECMARLIDRGGTELVTMTPVSGLAWIHQRIYMPGFVERTDPAIGVFSGTMRDNKILGEEEIAQFERDLPSEDERQIRVYGKFILFFGRGAFDRVALQEALETCAEPLWTGDLEAITHGPHTRDRTIEVERKVSP